MTTEQVNRHTIFVKIQENVQKAMIRQKERRRLNILLDTDKKIIAYSQQNMAFAVEPSEFLNKSIIDIIPLGEEAREAINQSFCIVTEKDEPYILEEKDFVTKIVPL